MDPILTIGPENGFGFYLAAAVVMAVNLVKSATIKWGGKKAKKIPSWVWIGLSILIAEGICILLKVDILSSVFGQDAPFSGFMAYAVSGGAIALSSNVLYKVAVKHPENNKVQEAEEAIREEHNTPVAEPYVPPEPVPQPVLEKEGGIEETHIVFLTEQPINTKKPIYLLFNDGKLLKMKVEEEND